MDPQQTFQQAVALHQGGRLLEAEALYRQLGAAHLQARRMLGLLRAQTGKFADALTDFDAVLALAPQDFGSWNNRALALRELGRFAEALQACDRSLALRPAFALGHNSRGLVLLDLQRPAEALPAFDAALVIQPGYVEALNNRGMALFALRRFDAAIASYDRALALAPEYADAWTHRALALRELNRFDDARASFDKALALAPHHVAALQARANLRASKLKDHAGAIADMERAVALAPHYDYAQGELLHLKMLCGDWRDFDEAVTVIHAGVRAGRRVIQPFAYQAIAQSPADLLACARLYAEHLYPLTAAASPPPRSKARIRLAYLSGELREHAVSYLMAGLFEQHDKDHFEVIALDNGHDDGGPTRARLNAAFDRILPVAHLSDADLAALIRAEEIDMLVNLNGIFGGMRMGVFAARPAPVQVSYLGTPGTLGSGCMDYLIADTTVLPPDEAPFYAEQIAWLPDTYWGTDNQRPIAVEKPTRADCGLPDDGFVFCNFNNSYKITPAQFASWMTILKQVDNSVLWLLEANALFAANLRAAASAQGVDPARLVFAAMQPSPQHLARLALADLCLDSLPYNAHTTASDALWAGLPILTCTGTTFPGRVAASQLHAIGLPELIAPTMADYEALAVALARDAARLAGLRAKLAQNIRTMPLFGTKRFTRAMEAAYRTMWDIALAGEKPRSFHA